MLQPMVSDLGSMRTTLFDEVMLMHSILSRKQEREIFWTAAVAHQMGMGKRLKIIQLVILSREDVFKCYSDYKQK